MGNDVWMVLTVFMKFETRHKLARTELPTVIIGIATVMALLFNKT